MLSADFVRALALVLDSKIDVQRALTLLPGSDGLAVTFVEHAHDPHALSKSLEQHFGHIEKWQIELINHLNPQLQHSMQLYLLQSLMKLKALQTQLSDLDIFMGALFSCQQCEIPLFTVFPLLMDAINTNDIQAYCQSIKNGSTLTEVFAPQLSSETHSSVQAFEEQGAYEELFTQLYHQSPIPALLSETQNTTQVKQLKQQTCFEQLAQLIGDSSIIDALKQCTELETVDIAALDEQDSLLIQTLREQLDCSNAVCAVLEHACQAGDLSRCFASLADFYNPCCLIPRSQHERP